MVRRRDQVRLMGTVIALDALLDARRIWRGQPAALAPSLQPTGWPALDAALPGGGWPETALTELLLPADGVGELRLLWPTLARLSQHGGVIALVAPPYLPYAAAWAQAGLRMERLQVVRADPREALWAAEQCLRSAVCAAVLCWPQQANDRSLRRLQVAAESGQCLGFALRPASAAANPSPAALRIAIDTDPAQLRVLKCRGGNAPPRPIPFALAPAASGQRADDNDGDRHADPPQQQTRLDHNPGTPRQGWPTSSTAEAQALGALRRDLQPPQPAAIDLLRPAPEASPICADADYQDAGLRRIASADALPVRAPG